MTTLRFQKLVIDRLAGIPRGSGFTLEDLSKDINLIHGPNGAGKSLTGQSLLALIWPAATTLERPHIAGNWKFGENKWSVELDAGHPTWRCNGVACEPPSLPPAESRGHHWLGLRELLTDEGPDAAATNAFAERIAHELLGGFDLNAVAQSLGLTSSPKRKLQLRKKFDDAKKCLAETHSQERELHAKSETLDTLSEQCVTAREADERRRRLDRALEHRHAADEVTRLERDLDKFEVVLAHLNGNEQKRLNEFRDRRRESERDLASAEQDLETAECAKAGAGFADGVVPNEVLETAGKDVVLISEAHREARQTEANREEAARELESRAAHIAPSVSTDILDSIGVTPNDEMAQYARDLIARREQTARVEAREREVAEVEKRLKVEAESTAAGSVDQVRRGLDVLQQWLAHPPQSLAPRSGWLVTLLLASGIIAALLLILAILHHWVWLLALVVAVVFAWLARPKPETANGPDDRATYQREYEAFKQPQPDSWTNDAVRSVWFNLSETWARLEIHKSAEQKLEQEQAEVSELRREVNSAEEQLKRTRSNLEEALGFGIDDNRGDWLHVLGGHLTAWQSAKVLIDRLSAKLEEQQNALERSLASFNGRVEQYVDRPAQDPSEAAGTLENLKQRAQEYREATIKADGAERNRGRAQSEIEQVGEQVDTLLASLGLDENREGKLSRWLEQLDQYREVKRKLSEARVRQSTIAADVGEGHSALKHDRARIETDRDVAEREADRLSKLEQEIGAIRREVENAKSDHRVEDAQRRLDKAKQTLEEELHDAEKKVVGHAVIERLREDATDRTQPAVLRHASALFQRITHGRYELRIEKPSGDPTFVAWDTQQEIQKSLNQLSAGERVQLLVSVRLGFLEQEKSGVRLPLILDETLGTTDDERAKAVIDTVVEVCRTGRQVFYFTAQPDEVGKWLGRLQPVEDIDLKQVDLARVRGLAEVDGGALVINRPAETPLPDPTGLTHEEYGRALGAAGLDPHRPVGMVPTWHLVDEPDLLHALAMKNVRCWGPFESLVVKGLVLVDGLDHDRIAVVVARARAVKAAFAAWHVGRGKTVDRAALDDSKVVSVTFLDRLTKLAASVDNDAGRFIDALEQGKEARWRSANTVMLREYLEEQGYLECEQRLTKEDIYHRALEETAREHAGVDLGDGWLDRMLGSLPTEQVRVEAGVTE